MVVSRTNLKLVDFRGKPQTPIFLNAKHLPSSAQSKLYELITRFDRLMRERPGDAAQILIWSEEILQIYGA